MKPFTVSDAQWVTEEMNMGFDLGIAGQVIVDGAKFRSAKILQGRDKSITYHDIKQCKLDVIDRINKIYLETV